MENAITRRRLLAGLSGGTITMLAGCPEEDGTTTSAPTSTITQKGSPTVTDPPPTDTSTEPPSSNRLIIPAGGSHLIGANTIETYLSVEWGIDGDLVLESSGAIELTPTTK